MTIIESLKQYENAVENPTGEAKNPAEADHPEKASDAVSGTADDEDFQVRNGNKIRTAERDGYVRRSPVQEIYVPRTYYRNCVLHILAGIAVVILLAAALMAFWKLGYISL